MGPLDLYIKVSHVLNSLKKGGNSLRHCLWSVKYHLTVFQLELFIVRISTSSFYKLSGLL